MIRIGIISDTHGLMRPEAVERLQGVDQIVHAGDIGRPEIITRLAEVAPVSAIRGNIDTAAWAQEFPATLRLECAGRMIHVIHDRNDLDFDPEAGGLDAVISGHSHRPDIETIDGVLYLNPGSAGPRRFSLPITVATLDVHGDELVPHIHDLQG